MQIAVWAFVLILAVVLGGGIAGTVLFMARKSANSKNNAARVLENAYAEAKTVKKEAILEAKEEVQNLKAKCDEEIAERRNEIMKAENRILQREEFAIKKEESIDKKIENLEQLQQKAQEKADELEALKQKTQEINDNMTKELEKVSAMTKEEAKNLLINKYVDEAKQDAASTVRQIEEDAKATAEKTAKEIVTLAVQKCATDHTSEITVTVVPLPNDDMKGRLIGREGRNIRAIENATGIDLIIDDTPEAVVLSGFDPIRREIARMSVEKLIMDGRIHPARIEEIVEKAQRDVESAIKEAGENAVYEAGIIGLHPEIVKTLGKLKYRTSYGQNALKHSLEVAHLAGLIATEIGADVKVAKRGGLLHDLGKALDHEMEGTHVALGVEMAKKFKENPAVIHCIEAHHGDVEYKSLEAIIVQTADAISSARPGARRESLDAYIKRLEQLEGIATSFKGVEKAYAIQAGREVRVVVQPEKFDDVASARLARDIAKRIEEELDYPGQIRVTVVREIRTTEIAK